MIGVIALVVLLEATWLMHATSGVPGLVSDVSAHRTHERTNSSVLEARSRGPPSPALVRLFPADG
jgi:hypothetical protein